MSNVKVGPNHIKFEIGVWYNKKDKSIHITGPTGENMHTTVNNNPNSIRCHQNLYDHLKRILEKYGCWPDED